MSFREKTRWAALIADLLIWAWYFNQVAGALPDGPANEADFLWLAAGATIATIVIHVAAITFFAIRRPKEASAPADERERAIERNSGATAHTLLAVCLVSVIIGSYGGWSKFLTVNMVLLVFIGVEIVRYALEIIAYRRAAL